MASDITPASSASFSLSNMLPSPGEQADALWAQKLADNGGYNYYHEIPLMDESPTTPSEARYSFIKRASHNGIKALTRGLEAKAVTEYMRVFAEGQDPTDHAAYTLVGTLAYSRGVQTTQRFDLDISGLVNGNTYMLAYARDNTGSSVRPSLSLVHGSNATY
jgi:hypothetical protein